MKCEMTSDCLEKVAYIDSSGWIYCTAHGIARQNGKRCRKLRPHELNRLERGEKIERF